MKTPEREAHEAHMAMRDRASFRKDGLIADKMRYRKALLLACGGDETKARRFLSAVDGDSTPGDESVESLAALLEQSQTSSRHNGHSGPEAAPDTPPR